MKAAWCAGRANLVLLGILSIGSWACSQSSGGAGSGGATSSSEGSGGSVASGGSAGSGGITMGSGGIAGSGGSLTGTGGGANASGGKTVTGTGGRTLGTGGTTEASGGIGTGGSSLGRTGGVAGRSATGQGGTTDATTGGASGGRGGTAADGTGGTTGTAGSTGTQSAGCGKTATRQDAKKQLTMQSGGATRYYLLYTPTNYDPNTPLPMVVTLHGANMNNWWAANDSSGFNLIQAANNKAILVYPQGTGDAPGTTSSWGTIQSGWDWNATSKDSKFLEELLASIEDAYCIDTKRIFVTGFSAGAFFTMNLACHHWKLFRAFAPVAGWGPGDMQTGHGKAPYCDDAEAAVPIIITQGTTDPTVVPELCGEVSRDFWIDRDGCTNTSSPMSTRGCVSYQGCRSGLAVAYCTHGGNHMVPSNAGAYIWDFFSTLD
jgi:polyhydroxybutyrate depolymerase